MNLLLSEILFFLALAIGAFLTPVYCFLVIRRREGRLVDVTVQKLLKLPGGKILEEAPQIVKNQRLFYSWEFLIAMGISLLGGIVALITIPERTPELVSISFLGPIALFILQSRYGFVLRAPFAQAVSEKLMEEGRLVQIDAWLSAFSACDWRDIGLLREELLLNWGSWQASKLTARDMNSLSFRRKAETLTDSHSEWVKHLFR